jgi:hypothetical protein
MISGCDGSSRAIFSSFSAVISLPYDNTVPLHRRLFHQHLEQDEVRWGSFATELVRPCNVRFTPVSNELHREGQLSKRDSSERQFERPNPFSANVLMLCNRTSIA